MHLPECGQRGDSRALLLGPGIGKVVNDGKRVGHPPEPSTASINELWRVLVWVVDPFSLLFSVFSLSIVRGRGD